MMLQEKHSTKSEKYLILIIRLDLLLTGLRKQVIKIHLNLINRNLSNTIILSAV